MDQDFIKIFNKEDAMVYQQLHDRNNELLKELDIKGVDIQPLVEINQNTDLLDATYHKDKTEEIKEIYNEFFMNINQMKEIASKYD